MADAPSVVRVREHGDDGEQEQREVLRGPFDDGAVIEVSLGQLHGGDVHIIVSHRARRLRSKTTMPTRREPVNI